jgi:hypothetical protein
VDTISIIQDDPADKVLLIEEMDTVYARAFLTIVALAGNDANAGMPGVHRRTRSASEVFEVSAALSVLFDPEPSGVALKNGSWSRRAWTFQEGALSARTLLFAQNVVHFTCCSTTWSENVRCLSETCQPPWAYKNEPSFLLRPRLNSSGIYFENKSREAKGLIRRNILSEVWGDVIKDMSRRNLTYETDVLFATAGVFGMLEKCFTVRGTYGIPASNLEEFIYWKPSNPGTLRRRRDLAQSVFNPSWSWAGWVGPVHLLSYYERGRPCEISSDNIVWTLLKEIDTQPVLLQPDVSQSSGRGTLDPGASTNSIVVTDSGLSQNLEEFPLLQFRTRTISYMISKSATRLSWLEELFPASRHSQTLCVTALNDDNSVVGTVDLDSSDVMSMHQRMVAKFAIISTTPYKFFRDWMGYPFVTDCPDLVHYRVLMLDSDNRIAERVGSGAIFQQAFDSSDSKWETVTLK